MTTEGNVVSGPRYAPSSCLGCAPGDLVYVSRTPHALPSLRRIDEAGQSRLVTDGYLGSTMGRSGRGVVFDRQEIRRNVGLYSELAFYDGETGRVLPMAGTQRLQDPDVSPDGRAIAAVREHGGARALVVVQLREPAGTIGGELASQDGGRTLRVTRPIVENVRALDSELAEHCLEPAALREHDLAVIAEVEADAPTAKDSEPNAAAKAKPAPPEKRAKREPIGEKLVLRIFDPNVLLKSRAELGFSDEENRLWTELVHRPHGIVLVTGPTGSGKTTTLYSTLRELATPEVNVCTIEDPIEMVYPYLNQMQVQPNLGIDFALGVRTLMRQDPDVIMVGEIRDQETAQMAIESSLTGHLVMSTLHTNSAPETVTRLLDMGMDPFNFADSLLGVLAQRLVRKLCSTCRLSREATPDEIDELLADWMHAFGDAPRPAKDEVLAGWTERFGKGGKLMHYHCTGCEKCSHSGFRGRAGLHELMTVSRGMRHLIQTGARADDLQKLAMAEGMRTLRQDGIEKVFAGSTTIGEVRATANG